MSSSVAYDEGIVSLRPNFDIISAMADLFRRDYKSHAYWSATGAEARRDSVWQEGQSSVDRSRPLDEIDDIARCENGWDGVGSLGPAVETIDHARRVLYALPSALLDADIALNLNGTISFEWEGQRGSAEIELGRTTFAASLTRADGTRQFLNGPAEDLPVSWLEEIKELLKPHVPSAVVYRWTDGNW